MAFACALCAAANRAASPPGPGPALLALVGDAVIAGAPGPPAPAALVCIPAASSTGMKPSADRYTSNSFPMGVMSVSWCWLALLLAST